MPKPGVQITHMDKKKIIIFAANIEGEHLKTRAGARWRHQRQNP